ncbi:P-loop NTPase family protein [Flindersiella endophytica]
MRDRVGGYLFIEAEAGMGKTALATYLAFTRDYPTHVTRLPGGASPETARTNLVAQLIARWELTEAAPGGVLPDGHDSAGWLAKQLLHASRRRDQVAEDTAVVLLVDGLDEAPTPRPGELPLGLPRQLPPATVLIATTCPGTPRPVGLGRVRRIEVESQPNRRDLLDYLERVARQEAQLAQAITAAGMTSVQFRNLLAERSGGVWIYATSVLDQVRDGRPATEIESLPASLAGYYADNIARWRSDPSLDWRTTCLPLLAMLAAARRPLPARDLAAWGGLDVGRVAALLRGPGGGLTTWAVPALPGCSPGRGGRSGNLRAAPSEPERPLHRCPPQDPAGRTPSRARARSRSRHPRRTRPVRRRPRATAAG